MVLRSKKLGGLVEAHQIIERVIQRPQVRIDFLRQIAGQKPEALAGFHRGPHEYDALHGVAFQCVHRACHREIRLARSCGTRPEGDVVVLDVARGTGSGSASCRAGRRGACAAAKYPRHRRPQPRPRIHPASPARSVRAGCRRPKAVRRLANRSAEVRSPPVARATRIRGASARRRAGRWSRPARLRPDAGWHRARRKDWRARDCRRD